MKQDLTDAEIMSKIAKETVRVPVEDFIQQQYLPFAYYVIRSRALSSMDGLKPVQRRILYSMYSKDKLLPNVKHKKAATVAANVMSAFHPHGNASIEASLAGLGQKFSQRVPLIDPAGSVGYATGDKPASARYWEARLTKAAVELVEEIDDHVLPMGRNFDDTLDEPYLLPVRWPVLIVNGTSGISVGYSSNIFPNNPTEVMDVAIALLRNPDLTIDEVLNIMPGPDFPTGGEIVGSDGIRASYETGKGSFVVRGRYNVNALSRGRHEIVFYELPYGVAAESINKKINDLKRKGQFKGISGVKDLADMNHPVKYSITLKSGVNPTLIVKELFQKTPLSIKLTSNNTFLENGMPVKRGILEVFNQFLELRTRCTRNRLTAQIEKNQKSIHRNNGLISVLFDIDKAISIIRESETSEIARKGLKKAFKIDDEQAEYILSMQLRKLTRSDRESLVTANDELKEKVKNDQATLDQPELFAQVMIDDLERTKKIIADKRRSVIVDKTVADLKKEETAKQKQAKELTKSQNVIVVQFADGSVYKGTENPSTSKLLPVRSIFPAKSDDDLYAVFDDGVGVKVPASYIPINKITAPEMLGINHKGKLMAIGRLEAGKKDYGMLVVTADGTASISNGTIPVNSDEFSVLSYDSPIVYAEWLTNKSSKLDLAMVTSDSLIARIPVDSIRTTGYGSKGVKAMNVMKDAKIVSAFIVGKKGVVVSLTPKSIKTTTLKEIPSRTRGAKGVQLHKLGARSGGEIVSAFGGENISMTDMMGNSMAIPEPTTRANAGLNFPTLGLLLGSNYLDA